MNYLQGLFGPAITTAEALPPFAAEGFLLPEEAAVVARAVPARRAEFAAGRMLARRAIAAIDPANANAAIISAPDRAPVWPQGLIGSISHSPALCGVAVARRSDDVGALGLDIEEREPLPAEIMETVLLPAELRALAPLSEEQKGVMARVIFSAKECAYKTQYPLTGEIFGFEMFLINPDLEAGRFSATWQGFAGPFAPGLTWTGRLRLADAHIITAMSLTRGQAEGIG